ncbi:MAG TPA: YqaJ viral recombinase family protein [Roseococcus sp.]|jgi:hypothetical protein|nr:YqaJ viral recombinase family protein [Roseococcus sp.]
MSDRALFPIPSDPAAWHAIRLRYIGASEVAALFDAQPDYSPGRFALWHVKAGITEPEPVDNPRVKWGLRLEEVIAQAAAEEEGWRVLPGQYAAHVCGLGATLDRIIAEPGPQEREAGLTGPGVLELKAADWLTHKKGWGEEPPMHILLQLQAQLHATGYGWGAVAVLVGGNDLRIYRYRARPKLQAEMERRVRDFWASVRAGQRPNADGSESAFRTLRALTPLPLDDEPAELMEDDEAAALAADVARFGAERRAAEKQEAEAKARLLEKLGSHRWAKVNGWKVSQAVTPAKPDRPAEPGEIIKGRAESRRLIVSERTEA